MKSGDATSAMKGATGWLRAASVLTLLLAAGHTLGMPWTPDRTERGAALVAALRAVTFEVMRSTRSYWDFY
ncbi:MAG: LIC_13387 family protein, partial [Betaproteobacteria bacterium]